MSEIPKKSKPISVRRYRIGDYAHYMGVGRDFLKHYEKCGLLSADHHDNGYRHFGFEQSSLILECMRLRNCGYTVREMGGMLRDLSGVEVRQSLHEAREALEKRIKHTQAIAAEIERLEEWFDIRQSSAKIGRSLQLKGVTICRTPTDPSFSRMSGSMKFCRSGSTGSRL